jgi:hypothetical protein
MRYDVYGETCMGLFHGDAGSRGSSASISRRSGWRAHASMQDPLHALRTGDIAAVSGITAAMGARPGFDTRSQAPDARATAARAADASQREGHRRSCRTGSDDFANAVAGVLVMLAAYFGYDIDLLGKAYSWDDPDPAFAGAA